MGSPTVTRKFVSVFVRFRAPLHLAMVGQQPSKMLLSLKAENTVQ
jgi:hypothetical protein